MACDPRAVALVRCQCYQRFWLRQRLEQICEALSFRVARGSRVLVKPNLVSGRRGDGLACSQPELVAVVAEWLLDQGATVTVGDSPAFGSALGVMRSVGIAERLARLPVRLVHFAAARPVRLAGGVTVGIAAEALDCDLLINLPRIKAHGQVLVSLAVKNLFGCVTGFRKALLHARYGDQGNRFEELLVDLLAVLPVGLSLADGVVAMHRDGPVAGEPVSLSILGAAVSPVALDTGLLTALGIEHRLSPVWRETARRKLVGSQPGELRYPLEPPAGITATGFEPPERLRPVSFHPRRLLASSVRRLWQRLRG